MELPSGYRRANRFEHQGRRRDSFSMRATDCTNVRDDLVETRFGGDRRVRGMRRVIGDR
jgi:hypothetical protein